MSVARESTSRPTTKAAKPAARRNRERPAGQAASKPAARKDPSAHRAGQAAAEWVKADSLKPWRRNPRRNDEAAVKVAASIKRFGFGAPMVARAETRELIAGHTRLKAVAILMAAWADADGDTRAAWVSGPEEERWCPDAIQLAESGLVPVRFLDVTEEQAHLLALADNRLGEAADWDSAALNDLLQELDRGDADLAGWGSADLDLLAASLQQDGDPTNAEGEWHGMPEYVQKDAFHRSLMVYFKTAEDFERFAKLIEQEFTGKTKFTWFPPVERKKSTEKLVCLDADAA